MPFCTSRFHACRAISRPYMGEVSSLQDRDGAGRPQRSWNVTWGASCCDRRGDCENWVRQEVTTVPFMSLPSSAFVRTRTPIIYSNPHLIPRQHPCSLLSPSFCNHLRSADPPRPAPPPRTARHTISSPPSPHGCHCPHQPGKACAVGGAYTAALWRAQATPQPPSEPLDVRDSTITQDSVVAIIPSRDRCQTAADV